MGWSFCPSYGSGAKERKRYVQDNLGSWENEKYKVKIIKQTIKGNIAWSVEERTNKTTHEIIRTILCDLLSYRKDSGWGNKSMDENMEPYYYSCPISFFKIAPYPKENAIKWRKEVVNQQNIIKEEKERMQYLIKSFQEGKKCVISLKGCKIPSVRIVGLKPVRGVYDGISYRISPRYIKNVEIS